VSGSETNSQTDILISEAYRWAFERGQRFGYASSPPLPHARAPDPQLDFDPVLSMA
jgi:hypothetical protein